MPTGKPFPWLWFIVGIIVVGLLVEYKPRLAAPLVILLALYHAGKIAGGKL